MIFEQIKYGSDIWVVISDLWGARMLIASKN